MWLCFIFIFVVFGSKKHPKIDFLLRTLFNDILAVTCSSVVSAENPFVAIST